MTVYFFVTDETFCMSRIGEIVTHCGQREERGRICITWTWQTLSELLGQGYRSAHSGDRVSWPRAFSMYYLVPREYIVHSSSMTGIGLCAINVQRIIGYGDDWNSVVSLCVNNNKLFVSHNQGITLLELASSKSQLVYKPQTHNAPLRHFREESFWQIKKKQVSSKLTRREEFRYLLETKLKEIKIFPSRCVFHLSTWQVVNRFGFKKKKKSDYLSIF